MPLHLHPVFMMASRAPIGPLNEFWNHEGMHRAGQSLGAGRAGRRSNHTLETVMLHSRGVA